MVLDDCFWNRISTFQALVNLAIYEIAYSNNSFLIAEIVCQENVARSLSYVYLNFVSTGNRIIVSTLYDNFSHHHTSLDSGYSTSSQRINKKHWLFIH